MSAYLFLLPIVLYLAGWLGESLGYWGGRPLRTRWARALLAFGWGAHGILLVMALLETGSGVATVLTAVAWLSILFYYGLMFKVSSSVFPFIFPPLSIGLLITAFFSYGGVPVSGGGGDWEWAFQPYLLPAHIISVLSGFILFGLACVASGVYLIQERRIKAKASGVALTRLPSLGTLEHYNSRAITLGFFLLTIGLLLGLLVGGVENLSSRFFSLRQAIPASTWLVYAAFLIIHDLQGRRGRFGAILSIAGFAVVVLSLGFEIHFLSSTR